MNTVHVIASWKRTKKSLYLTHNYIDISNVRWQICHYTSIYTGQEIFNFKQKSSSWSQDYENPCNLKSVYNFIVERSENEYIDFSTGG